MNTNRTERAGGRRSTGPAPQRAVPRGKRKSGKQVYLGATFPGVNSDTVWSDPLGLKGVNIPIRLLSWAFPLDDEATGVTGCGTR